MRRLHTLALVVAVMVTAGCGASGKPSPNAAGTGGVQSNGPGKPGTSGTATPGPGGATTAPGGSTTGPGATANPGGGGSSASAKPTSTPHATTSDGSIHPSHVATEKELPIDATVTPSCVIAGTVATLKVTTKVKATIAYVAIYNGDKSGAAPPWGEGYGGNDHGEADGKGQYSSTWTVAANAPSGPARVMVVVGYNGKQRNVYVPFSVGEREVGGCGT